MAEARRHLAGLGLPDRDLGELPSSARRFGDGAQYRVEIPSVEGPEPFRAVLEAATERELRVHRISQGSGMMLLTDDDIAEMVALGREHAVEVCLFVGPRAAWDIGVQASAPAGRVVAGSLRGADQLAYALEDVLRGCRLGVRSILVADTGQLWVLGRMKRAGDLPADLEIKISISLPVTNPATARPSSCRWTSTSRAPTTSAAPSATTRPPSWSGSRPRSTSSSPSATPPASTPPASTWPAWPWPRPASGSAGPPSGWLSCDVTTPTPSPPAEPGSGSAIVFVLA
jgi:hypothetical protein